MIAVGFEIQIKYRRFFKMKIRYFPAVASVLLATSLFTSGWAGAQTSPSKESTHSGSPEVEETYNSLKSNSDVQKVLEFIESDADKTLEEQIEMTEIPAPPYMEEEKAAYYKDKLMDLGLEDVHIDETGNVIGTRPGNGDGPTVAVAAHLDIAFPEGTDTTVTEKDGIYYAPGIGDDTGGLAAILSVLRGFNEEDIKTTGDILFVGTVGEEDDFRGAKAFFEEHKDLLDGFVSVDGRDPVNVTHGGTAGATVKFNYDAPGGHASGDYQTPSATHALGRAVAEIADLGEDDPKTTFNVGTVEGGTRENAKAEKASMLTEFRTDGPNADEMKQKLIDAAENGAKKENERWGKTSENGVTVETETKIDIPGGQLPKDSMIVQAAAVSATAIGKEPTFSTTGMNDSNYSYGVDVPGINLGGGGKGGNAHSLDEWYDPTDAFLGPQKIFMTLLGLVGMEGVSKPLLTNLGDGDEDTQKPEITIESPKDQSKTNRETVTVNGIAKDENLDWVKVNGKKVIVEEDGSFSKRIMLENGKNKIKVVAQDKAENKTKKKITVFSKFDAPTIENLKPTNDINLQTGDSVKIEMDSESGLHPIFTIRMPLAKSNLNIKSKILSSINDFPMMETKKGHYVGYWTVPSGLKAGGAEIKVMLTDDYGNETNMNAKGKLFINVKDK